MDVGCSTSPSSFTSAFTLPGSSFDSPRSFLPGQHSGFSLGQKIEADLVEFLRADAAWDALAARFVAEESREVDGQIEDVRPVGEDGDAGAEHRLGRQL